MSIANARTTAMSKCCICPRIELRRLKNQVERLEENLRQQTSIDERTQGEHTKVIDMKETNEFVMKDNQKENDPKKMSKADGFKNDKK